MTNLTPPQTTVGSRWRGFSNPYRALCAILAVLQLFLPSLVVALPSDGNVVGGHATIQQVNPHQLDIQQTTDKAILNWKSFSIAGDETVHFMQPSVSSIALNRVVGTDPSVILGHLQSNGRIFLLNPNGILFGAGAQIDVGGLLATTLQIRDEDFMAGRYLFAQDPLKGLRTVINRGTIQVSDHGFVFLAAPGVSNEGLIVANLGTVVLGSGQALTVDLMGDGLINYALSGKVLDHVMGVDGKPLSSAVSNTGTIQADGGHVVLHAKAAGEIFSSVVNQSGVIRARSLESHGGVVQLLGGDETLVAATAAGAMRPAGDVSGAVVNTGMIDVAAGAPNAAQGSVTMAGERVGQFGSIVATGGEGANGGDVLIASTTRTLLASGSTIDVSGIGHSSGGRLRVWSDHNTFFDSGATILARGGELGGNGGFVELSGKETLGFAGMVNALAPFGSAGTLLLDPRNITIATAGGVAYNNGLNNLFGNNVGATTTITPASINGQLTNVVLQANNDITVTNAIAMTNAGVGITMQAGRSIAVNANVSTNNGNISLTANDSSAIAADRAAGAGNITMAGGTTLNAGTGSLSLTIDSSAVGGFTPGTITAQTLAGGAKTITTATGTSIMNGVISGVGGLTKNGVGALTLSGNNTYTGATTINAGTLQLGAANRISNASALTVAGGATFNLNNFAETIGALSGAGNVTLGTGRLTTGGNNTSTTYSGIMSGTGGLTKAGTGIFTFSGANTYTGATVINAGTLQVAGGAAIADTSAVSLANVAGTTLDLNGTNETIGSLAGGGATGGNVSLGVGTLTAGGNNTSTTYSGVMSGTGGLTKAGTGIFTLSGVNTYTGATTINAGTLRLGAANRIADTSALTVAGGATFNLNNFAETIGSLAGAGNVTLGTGTLTAGGDNTATIYSGIMSGTGGLTKQGTGAFTLSGNNTYSGATNINAGTLTLGAANRIANASAVTVAGGATFDLNNFVETIGSLAGAGNVTLGTGIVTTGGNNTSTTYSGVMSGTGGLTKAGTGIFTLSGVNTYTGATTINAGTLRVAGGAAIADTSAVSLANVAGTTLDLNGTNETIGSLAGGGATGGNVTLGVGTLTAGGNNTSTTYNGIVSGTGGVTKAGTGAFTLSRANTYSGVTNVSAGTLVAAVNNALGTVAGGTTVANGATLGFSGGINYATAEPITLNAGATLSNLAGNNIFAGPITLAAGSETVTTAAGTTLTSNGVIFGAGALTKDGTGTLIYGGNNTYTGATTVNAGTLQLGAANRIANTNAVTVNAGAIFNLSNFAETIGSLSGAGNVTLGSATLTTGDATSTTFSGVMSGTGGLTKQGTGVFTLSGNNTYTGTTNVNAGTLVAAANNALGTAAGGTTVAAGATLGLSGGVNYSTVEPVTLNGGTLSNLAGNNTFAGPITLAANSAVSVADGTTMTVGGTVNGGSQLIVSSGTGGINFLSAIGGTTPLSSLSAMVGSIALGPVTTVGTQTYTGATTLNGNLTTTNSAITLNSPVTLGANTIMNSGNGAIAMNGTVNGSFTLTANSTGTTTFNGAVGNSTALTSLTTNAGGTTAINSGSVTTSGDQTYNDNVTMNQTTTLTSTGGTITFGGNATNNAAGSGITVDAPTINLTGGTTVATTGNGPLNFFTDTLNPNSASIDAGAGVFSLAPSVLTRTIEFGDVNTGRVTDVYYGSNFAGVTAGSFTIGRPTHTGNIFVTGVAAAPSAINIVNGGTGSVTFETASYVSGDNNFGVVGGSGGITIGSSLTLGTGTLRLTTTGAITQTAGSLTADTAGLSAASGINVVQPANNVTTLAAQTTAGNLAFTDTNGFTIDSISATVDGFHPAITDLAASAGSITLQSGGAVTQTQKILASTLNLQGSGPYTLTNSANDVVTLAANTTGNVQYNNANALVLGASTVSGSFDVIAGGAITQSGAVTVTGTTTLAAGAANDITLTNAGNDFSTVGITSGNNVSLTDTNALVLGSSTVSGNLNVTTNGALTQSGAATVTGTTTLAAGAANDITLTNAGNDFSTVGITSGNNATLTDANALVLGASTVSGNLALTTGGTLSQTGALAVIGTTSFTATAANTDILLDTQANNFGGAVAFAGTQTNLRDVQLRNVNAGATVPTLAGVTNLRNLTLQFDNASITLPSLTASGNVNAVAGGAITQTGAVTVAGGTTLAAGVNDITLSNAANNFNTVDITSSTNVSVTDTNALNLGASTIGGTLNVTTGGALTQSGVLNVAGATTLTSGANDITLTNGGNNFSIIGITSGNNVALANANALVLGTSTVTGTFNVTNGGALTQSGALNVTGTTTLVGGANDITLNSAGNNFSAVGVTSGNNVTLTDANALTMNTSTVSGNIAVSANNLTIGAPVVSAGGNITLTGVSTVTQSANLTAAGANTVTVTTTTGSITMAAAATTSSGTGTITYTAGTNVTLGSLSTGGGVNVSAGGSVLSAAGSGTNVTAGANSTLQAFNGVVGTQAAPLTVNVAPGTLSIRATTAVAGISAFLTGTVLPGNTLTLLNVPPGLVCFNGCTVPPSNNPFAGVFGLAPSFNLDSVVPWYLHEPSDPPVISVMSTYLPETVVAEAKTDVKSDNQSVAREIPPCFPESACKPGASILAAPADGKDPELPAAK